MSERWERDLGSLIWNAQTPGDVEAILKLAEERWGIRRIPVGRKNNIGTIRIASDPGLALLERVTNGIDSLIEMQVLLSGCEPASPEAAAHELFGVPEGGIGEMTDSERRALAENLVVSLHDSGAADRPTIRVEDRGIGQHPSDFHTTLLSLNEENKVGKPYTMGTYGQGGSVTLGFSQWTVFVSRRHPELLDGSPDRVGWTVAFEEETDPTKEMLPMWVWVVGDDGAPLSLPPDCLPELDHGTRITHVNYDVQQLKGPFTTQVWQFLHAALFDPALPFLLTGDRPNDTKKRDGSPDSRVIIGNVARLANVAKAKGALELAAEDSHHVDLGPQYGTVEIAWWALTRPESSSSTSDPAGAYVQANSAVSLTLHGQRQDAERRTWIKDKAQLPFLYKNLIVHIDANGLTPIGRRELFASTRERATESALRRLIYDRVAELMRSDGELKRLNHEEKEKLLRRSTAAANDRVRRRLGKFIKTKLKGTSRPSTKAQGAGVDGSGTDGRSGSGAKSGRAGGGGGGPGPGRNTDDSHLPNVPTHFRFDGKKVRVPQGRAGYVWIDVDAKNGYLPRHDDDLVVDIDGSGRPSPEIRSRSKLLGGRARWAVSATDETPLGDYEMRATLLTANGVLRASIPIEVVEPPKQTGEGRGGTDEDTGPDVQWVYKAAWDEHKMDATSVGYVTEDDESTIIWVNRDFDLLARALSSSRLTAEQISTRADRYQYPVACGLWLQHHELKETEPKPDENYLQKELHRLAEAVLVAMDPDVDLAVSEDDY